jgi:hypothetical protein
MLKASALIIKNLKPEQAKRVRISSCKKLIYACEGGPRNEEKKNSVE